MFGGKIREAGSDLMRAGDRTLFGGEAVPKYAPRFGGCLESRDGLLWTWPFNLGNGTVDGAEYSVCGAMARSELRRQGPSDSG